MLGQLDGPSAVDDALRRVVVELARSGGSRIELEPERHPPGSGCAVLDFARSGAMWLTGDAVPVALEAPLVPHLRALCLAISTLSEALGSRVELDPAQVLCGRAVDRGFVRRGRRSANGSCRLIPCADGWLAFNLPRASDHQLVEAIVGGASSAAAPWDALSSAARHSGAEALVERAQLVGVAAAALSLEPPEVARPPVEFGALGRTTSKPIRRPKVIDFSAMWAGPLCASILARAGASVCKVEDPGRPDAARVGDPLLFHRLHDGHRLVNVPFSKPDGRRKLHRLVDEADVVIESSRPRALEQLGLTPERFLAEAEGRVWISITGYGRTGRGANRVAFGDDAAVAGGLVGWADPDRPVFCADAVADPLSGLFAGFGGLVALGAGGGRLVDVSMSDASAAMRKGPRCEEPHRVVRDAAGGWLVRHGPLAERVLTPAEALGCSGG